MNDYGIGAIEALSWARAILRKCGDLESFVSARGEIDAMLLRLVSSAAVSFKNKTELLDEI